MKKIKLYKNATISQEDLTWLQRELKDSPLGLKYLKRFFIFADKLLRKSEARACGGSLPVAEVEYCNRVFIFIRG